MDAAGCPVKAPVTALYGTAAVGGTVALYDLAFARPTIGWEDAAGCPPSDWCDGRGGGGVFGGGAFGGMSVHNVLVRRLELFP